MASTTYTVHLPAAVVDEARAIAVHENFPEVLRLLNGSRAEARELTPDEVEHLRTFATYLRLRAELHYPCWDDSRPGYVPADEDAFHEVNMGLHEKLQSALWSATAQGAEVGVAA